MNLHMVTKLIGLLKRKNPHQEWHLSVKSILVYLRNDFVQRMQFRFHKTCEVLLKFLFLQFARLNFILEFKVKLTRDIPC